MLWGNSLLNILVCLHYFAIHAVGGYNSRNFNTDYSNKNKSGSGSANNSGHYSASIKCENGANLSSGDCSNFSNNNYYHRPKYVKSVPVKSQYNNPYYDHYGGSSGWWDTNNSNRHTANENIHRNQIQYQPVYYYANPYSSYPLRKRVDVSHSKPPSPNHQYQHYIPIENPNQRVAEHHEVMTGWGWPKGHQTHESPNPTEPKKGKKKKKGPIGKLLQKFKPKHKPVKLTWKEVPECNGFENFIKDLEIISLGLGWAGFAKATLALALHILNQGYLFFSLVVVGLPERLATFVDLIVPMTTPEQLRTVLAIVGLLDYLVNLKFSFPTGNLIVIIDFFAEIFTFASLALAGITIFDDIVEEKVEALFGIDLREVFEGYGCNNPFSKQMQIEQLFEKLNGWN